MNDTILEKHQEIPGQVSPSITDLIFGVLVSSVFCLSMHYPAISTFASILVGIYSFYSTYRSPEARRPVTSRDFLTIGISLGILVALILFVRDREWPAFDRFVARPPFIIAIWLLLCGSCVWIWWVGRFRARASGKTIKGSAPF